MGFLSALTAIAVMLAWCSAFKLPRVSKYLSANRLFSTVEKTYIASEKFLMSINATTSNDFTGDLLIIPFFKPRLNSKGIEVSDKEDSDSSSDDEINKSPLQDALISNIPKNLSPEVTSLISEIIEEGNFKAGVMDKQIVRVGPGFQSKMIALVGLGPEKKADNPSDLEVTVSLKFGKLIGSLARDAKAKTVGVILPNKTGNSGLSQIIIGFHDSVYTDKRFRSENKQKPYLGATLQLLNCKESVVDSAQTNLALSKAIVEGVEFAKDLVMAPPNSKTPLAIAIEARAIAAESNFVDCKILGEKECKELGMGAYLGVQQGSMFPPQFIHLTYRPEKPRPEGVLKVALIGKGLTFDSGGYNLKAGAGSMIEMMKFDMGGCAAVLGCAKSIGKLKPQNVEVHFISAVCENMVSAQAMRPGDVLVASNGKTIEVANTDAEGRLTLADALVYAEKLGVDVIIDLATLTGACMVALGDKVAGLYSPDNQLRDRIVAAAQRTQEGIWPMPLEAQYKDMIKSHIADLKNVGGKSGGSITAALFLEEFVKKAKWAHIDMAGPVWDNKEMKPTGYGVKLLVDYLVNV